MRLLLAPIQGITDANYRNHYNSIFGGIDEYYSPFISPTSNEEFSSTFFNDIRPEKNTAKVIPQLLGNNGVYFKEFANRIVAMGYNEINWNIGCPFKNVTRKKKGSGLLPYPDLIREILDEVCKDLNYDLTVKMRLGLNQSDEGIKVIEVLNDYPIKNVMIHARTGIQQYTGTVNLDAFDHLYKNCNHDITYNGDIFTVDDFNKIQSRYPDINSFMLGRGALRDPFLPAAIKGDIISNDKKIKTIRDFHDLVYNYYRINTLNDFFFLNRMKEFWTYTHVHLDETGELIKQIRRSQSLIDYINAVENILDNKHTWL